ncbi:hypothetical protein [Agarilytica rhodophyticola]|uniref:hypothetical protein n=1 Tax=Agarilytica rhodophyticola TaxID=1737490 RepID=UPI00131A17B6|nr:hypothetical protein [Agarilytica rhodophyticola]
MENKFNDGDYRIELNPNYEAKKANAFLIKKATFESDEKCIGSIDFENLRKKWRVSVDDNYDPKTDSDSRIVGYFTLQDDALNRLWLERFNV